ncbi:hypothetical protein WA026_016126 [Henosepilachna vigintioctopunctata]|uniref:Uncharacterized protein n=1 Tax=Henosepilachna vigintioctopunctata TaxID=420089 RepID=A0AAW1TL63_9CUCU
MNEAVDYVNSEGAQNTEVPQEDIKHLVREKDLLQKLVNKMEYTINLQKEVIASLNDGSLKSASNVKNNFDKRVMSAPSTLTLSYTKSLTTESGSATKNPSVNITKMDSKSATPNPDIPKPKAGNIIQVEDVENAIALAENSIGKNTNKPPTLKDGYQGNKPGEWTEIVRKKKKSSMRSRPSFVIGGYIGDSNVWGFKTTISNEENLRRQQYLIIEWYMKNQQADKGAKRKLKNNESDALVE